MSHNYDDLRCYSCDQFCCDCELCKCCRTAITHHGHIATVIAAKEAEIVRLRGLITQMVDAYDFPVDGELYADDYLMGVLDLLRKEARRD